MKIGLLGGNFNPPHTAHALMAIEAIRAMELDELWFVPALRIVDKNPGGILVKDRVDMIRAMSNNIPRTKVITDEVEYGFLYTYETVSHLKNKFPLNEYYLILGGDRVLNFPKWQSAEQLSALLSGMCMCWRTNSPPLTGIHPWPHPNMKQINIDSNLSSTYIRSAVKRDRNIQYLVDRDVQIIIENRNLYK